MKKKLRFLQRAKRVSDTAKEIGQVKELLQVGEPYKPYIRRFRHHPFILPVVLFLVLFFFSLVALIALGGSTVGPSDSHVVELSVEGQRNSIPTRAATVGEFLERVEIKLAENDIVEPDADTPIDADKFHINVYRARPVTIIEDTGKRTFAYSAAATPRSVAQQAGIAVYPEDRVSSEVPDTFLREGVLGEKLIIERSIPVNLNLYGTPLPIRTFARTVADLLKEKDVKLEPSDTVQPSLETPITLEVQVFVLRNGTQVVSVEEQIPMPTEVTEDSSLSPGVQAVRQKGAPGKKNVTYQIELQNGREVGRRKIQEVVVVAPVKQIMIRGPLGSFGQALARLRGCEAGGNYANKKNPTYRGAYQFDRSTWNNYGGYYDPADAPPAIQDQKATETYQRRGWKPWPGCTAKLGLQDIYR